MATPSLANIEYSLCSFKVHQQQQLQPAKNGKLKKMKRNKVVGSHHNGNGKGKNITKDIISTYTWIFRQALQTRPCRGEMHWVLKIHTHITSKYYYYFPFPNTNRPESLDCTITIKHFFSVSGAIYHQHFPTCDDCRQNKTKKNKKKTKNQKLPLILPHQTST